MPNGCGLNQEIWFFSPVPVKWQVGPSTYSLADGKVWNIANVAVCPENRQTPINEPNVETDSPRRPRQKKNPGWLKDFVNT